MRFYIIKRGVEFVIYKVRDDDVLCFEEKYTEQILLQANSLMELLQLFEREILFDINY